MNEIKKIIFIFGFQKLSIDENYISILLFRMVILTVVLLFNKIVIDYIL